MKTFRMIVGTFALGCAFQASAGAVVVSVG